MDAVTMHTALLSHRDQEQIQLLEALRHAGEPPLATPRRQWRDTDSAVGAEVVRAHEVGAQRAIELGECETRRADRFATHQVTRQLRQKLGVHRAKQPLHLAAALGPRDARVGEFKVQLRRHCSRCRLVKSLP